MSSSSSTSAPTAHDSCRRHSSLPDFKGFDRGVQPKVHYVTMTEYDETYGVPFAFGPETFANILGEVVSRAGKKQLRIAETEKYPHVTYFFNAGNETPFPGEDRTIIPSPKVATYDLQAGDERARSD